ncbi:hypothetical protein GCM10023334_097100 [Nonomuraea thailandensis]
MYLLTHSRMACLAWGAVSAALVGVAVVALGAGDGDVTAGEGLREGLGEGAATLTGQPGGPGIAPQPARLTAQAAISNEPRTGIDPQDRVKTAPNRTYRTTGGHGRPGDRAPFPRFQRR